MVRPPRKSINLGEHDNVEIDLASGTKVRFKNIGEEAIMLTTPQGLNPEETKEVEKGKYSRLFTLSRNIGSSHEYTWEDSPRPVGAGFAGARSGTIRVT